MWVGRLKLLLGNDLGQVFIIYNYELVQAINVGFSAFNEPIF